MGDDAVFVIDDQFAPKAPKIKAAIAAITPKPVQFLLNTHYHFDHTGGNEAFGSSGSGGSPDGVVAAADRVPALATDKTRIIPGHGPLASKATLQAYRDMLATVAQRIREQRRAGKSDDQIRAAKPAADYDATWGKGFIQPERFVQMMLDGIPR